MSPPLMSPQAPFEVNVSRVVPHPPTNDDVQLLQPPHTTCIHPRLPAKGAPKTTHSTRVQN